MWASGLRRSARLPPLPNSRARASSPASAPGRGLPRRPGCQLPSPTCAGPQGRRAGVCVWEGGCCHQNGAASARVFRAPALPSQAAPRPSPGCPPPLNPPTPNTHPQVMLTRNISSRQGLVNGARGVVERFSDSQRLPVVRFASGRVLTLGRERWAVSLGERPCVCVCGGGGGGGGGVGVRGRDDSSPWGGRCLHFHPKHSASCLTPTRPPPRAPSPAPPGGRTVAQRVQVPLDLAWAMSVHKSQGMTLDRRVCVVGGGRGARASPGRRAGAFRTQPEPHAAQPCPVLPHSHARTHLSKPRHTALCLVRRVEVSLEKAFEPGMAYVALSRVRSMEGLRIKGGIAPQALRAGTVGSWGCLACLACVLTSPGEVPQARRTARTRAHHHQAPPFSRPPTPCYPPAPCTHRPQGGGLLPAPAPRAAQRAGPQPRRL